MKKSSVSQKIVLSAAILLFVWLVRAQNKNVAHSPLTAPVSFVPQITTSNNKVVASVKSSPASTPNSAPITSSLLISPKSEKLSELLAKDKAADFFFGRHYWMGFTKNNEALFNQDNFSSGNFIWINPQNAKARSSAPLSQYQTSWSTLSKDGSVIFTRENADDPNKPVDKFNFPLSFALDSQNLNLLSQVNVGIRTTTASSVPFANMDNLIAMSILEWTWDAKENDYTNNAERGARIEIWNWKTGKKERALKYAHATGAAEMVASPDGKYISCLFMREILNNDGNVDKFVDAGDSIIDVLDAQTGEILWHIEQPQEKFGIGYPFFFTSNTQLITKNTLLDLPTRKATPLFKSSKDETRMQCVGGVADAENKVFFATKRGLELWDTAAAQPLHRWPDIKKVQGITLSPDKSLMAVEEHRNFQFWKFKPDWLK